MPGDRQTSTNAAGRPRPLTMRQQTVYGAIRQSYAALEEGVREAYLIRRTGMTRIAIRRHVAALARKGLVQPGSPIIPRQ